MLAVVVVAAAAAMAQLEDLAAMPIGAVAAVAAAAKQAALLPAAASASMAAVAVGVEARQLPLAREAPAHLEGVAALAALITEQEPMGRRRAEAVAEARVQTQVLAPLAG
jgi:putative ubiquitin-RnfH superfamily antitoxin RatB of RatAB toxin-antitoxin module